MKLSEVNYKPLEAMSTVWNQAFRTAIGSKGREYMRFIVVAILLFGLAAASIQFGILLFVIVFGVVAREAVKLKNQIWSEFARVNNWSVTPSAQAAASWVPPAIAGVGRARYLSDIVHAQFDGHACDLYSYSYTVGTGRYSRTYYFTIARVLLPKMFPHILLDGKQNMSGPANKLNATQEIKLEGNFSKYFSLYVAPGEHIDALAVITPDIMQTLIQENKTQDIQIIDDNLFIIDTGDNRSTVAMPGLLESVSAFTDQIAHKAKTIQYDAPRITPSAVALAGSGSSTFSLAGVPARKAMWAVFILPFVIGAVVSVFSVIAQTAVQSKKQIKPISSQPLANVQLPAAWPPLTEVYTASASDGTRFSFKFLPMTTIETQADRLATYCKTYRNKKNPSSLDKQLTQTYCVDKPGEMYGCPDHERIYILSVDRVFAGLNMYYYDPDCSQLPNSNMYGVVVPPRSEQQFIASTRARVVERFETAIGSAILFSEPYQEDCSRRCKNKQRSVVWVQPKGNDHYIFLVSTSSDTEANGLKEFARNLSLR